MTSEGAERRLAAIVSADVVGYTRLMAEDEQGTIRTLNAYRALIAGLVSDHHGRVVDAPGDNILAEFPNALDAVQCAVEAQRVLQVRNQSLPEQRWMLFRIGVHLGDVAVDGERIYGDGVNIAARLEGLADPGGTCISEDVLHQVQRKLELDFDDLGEQTVKNIPDPVHAYRVREAPPVFVQEPTRRPVARWAAAAATIIAVGVLALVVQRIWSPPPLEPETIEEATAEAPLTAIAVLPFDDMSPGSDQAWLANGMAEDLIESLSRIEELRVSPTYAPYRDDPRFTALLRRMGLEE